MAESVLWLHSSGPENKNPDYDLGALPSVFEIAEKPMNNLFNNLIPEDLQGGWEDYRCFYITNKHAETIMKNTKLKITKHAKCATINIGSKIQNEVQEIVFQGTPVKDGYLIIAMEWGPELLIQWTGDWSSFASAIQKKIRMVQYHEKVTATGGSTCTVTFQGDMEHRKCKLITLVQNNLTIGTIREY